MCSPPVMLHIFHHGHRSRFHPEKDDAESPETGQWVSETYAHKFPHRVYRYPCVMGRKGWWNPLFLAQMTQNWHAGWFWTRSAGSLNTWMSHTMREFLHIYSTDTKYSLRLDPTKKYVQRLRPGSTHNQRTGLIQIDEQNGLIQRQELPPCMYFTKGLPNENNNNAPRVQTGLKMEGSCAEHREMKNW